MNIPVKTQVKPDEVKPVVEDVKPAATAETKQEVAAVKPAAFYNPSNWDIVAVAVDSLEIVCVNNATGDTFRGTRVDFCNLIRS